MISTKMINKVVMKWQSLAAKGKKRIALSRTISSGNAYSASSVANEGHFVVYTTDQRRFEMPLAILKNHIFQELCRISEGEFGLPSEGPIRMPCDSVLMEYIVSVIRKGLEKELQRALLKSMVRGCCPPSSNSLYQRRQQLICC